MEVISLLLLALWVRAHFMRCFFTLISLFELFTPAPHTLADFCPPAHGPFRKAGAKKGPFAWVVLSIIVGVGEDCFQQFFPNNPLLN
jgi:hypothetical protein